MILHPEEAAVTDLQWTMTGRWDAEVEIVVLPMIAGRVQDLVLVVQLIREVLLGVAEAVIGEDQDQVVVTPTLPKETASTMKQTEREPLAKRSTRTVELPKRTVTMLLTDSKRELTTLKKSAEQKTRPTTTQTATETESVCQKTTN